MSEKSSRLKESPSQTAGPYVHIGCLPNQAGISGVYTSDLGSEISLDTRASSALKVRIFDGNGELVRDAIIEYVQEVDGQTLWGRTAFDGMNKQYDFHIAEPDIKDDQKYLSLWIAARGINLALHTRVYFHGDTAMSDPVLSAIEPSRQETLFASWNDDGYAFDIHLQGEQETVFFDI